MCRFAAAGGCLEATPRVRLAAGLIIASLRESFQRAELGSRNANSQRGLPPRAVASVVPTRDRPAWLSTNPAHFDGMSTRLHHVECGPTVPDRRDLVWSHLIGTAGPMAESNGCSACVLRGISLVDSCATQLRSDYRSANVSSHNPACRITASRGVSSLILSQSRVRNGE